MTQPLERLSFDKPDEVREGEMWRLELLNLAGGAQVGRITVQPGWKWSDHMNRSPGRTCAWRRTSSIRSPGECTSPCRTAPKWNLARVRSPPCRPDTTPGSSATKPSSPSTGKVPPCGRALTPERYCHLLRIP